MCYSSLTTQHVAQWLTHSSYSVQMCWTKWMRVLISQTYSWQSSIFMCYMWATYHGLLSYGKWGWYGFSMVLHSFGAECSEPVCPWVGGNLWLLGIIKLEIIMWFHWVWSFIHWVWSKFTLLAHREIGLLIHCNQPSYLLSRSLKSTNSPIC